VNTITTYRPFGFLLAARRDPFADFDALVRQAFGSPDSRNRGFVPAADTSRDGDDAVVTLELPGIDIDNDVTVEIDDKRLVVRGERRSEQVSDSDGDGPRRSVREIRYGSFRREFGLPAHVTEDAVSASYDAGVLHIRVAGAYATAEPRRIQVTARPQTSAESAEQAETTEAPAA
jgi:HSP20 family protein